MPYVHFKDFKAGMDRTRDVKNTPLGALYTLKNAHITRGGDIERTKAWRPAFALPSGTKGHATLNGRHYVFAASAVAAPPAGVTVQILASPTGAAIDRILDVEAFDGRLYVVVRYADGLVFHFYDQQRLTDWDDVTIAGRYSNLQDVAARIAREIDGDANYTATASGAVVTVEGREGVAYPFSASVSNPTGSPAGAIAAAVSNEAGQPLPERAATATISVVSGSQGNPGARATGFIVFRPTGSGFSAIANFVANGVALIPSSQIIDLESPFSSEIDGLVSEINSQTHGYTAARTSDGGVTITAPTKGASANGATVSATTAAGVEVASTGNFANGENPTNQLTSLKFGAVELLASPVTFSNASTFATEIAAAVNAATGATFSAVASGTVVTLTGDAGQADTLNGLELVATTTGDVSVSTTPFANGRAVGALSPRTIAISLTGTFAGNDVYGVTLGDRQFLMSGSLTGIGLTAWTYKSKMYTTSASVLRYSALLDPSEWINPDDGAGAINVSNQRKGDRPLTVVAEFQTFAAIFSQEDIKLFDLNENDDLNNFVQTVDNTGTFAPDSAVPFANTDLFYLDTSGVRSLRSRSVDNAAFADDVGTRIDDFVQEEINRVGPEKASRAIGFIEPEASRYWLAIAGKIFVFSYFPNRATNISAWSFYEPGFEAESLQRIDRSVFARAGDTIYAYGGATGQEYPNADETPVEIVVPFMDADSPAFEKEWRHMHFGGLNEWTIQSAGSLDRPDIFTPLAVVPGDTFELADIGVPIGQRSTAIAFRLVCRAAGRALLSRLTVHYEVDAGAE